MHSLCVEASWTINLLNIPQGGGQEKGSVAAMRSVAPRTCTSYKKTVNNWTNKFSLLSVKMLSWHMLTTEKTDQNAAESIKSTPCRPVLRLILMNTPYPLLFPVAIQLHHNSRHSMFVSLRREHSQSHRVHHQSLHHRLVAQALMSRPMFFISCSRPNRCEVGSHFLHSQKQQRSFQTISTCFPMP